MATLENVEAELAERVRGAYVDLRAAGLDPEITEGFRTLAEQRRLYSKMQLAIQHWGSRWQEHANLAAVPGTSDHGPKKDHPLATAVDLAIGNPTPERKQRHLEIITRWGLRRTIPSEYWHVQLAPKRGPMPNTPPPLPAATPQEVTDLPKYADKFVWPNGHQVQVFPNGTIECFGAKSWGSMNDLQDQYKQGFVELHAVGPVDPNDSQRGYIAYSQSGQPFTFEQGTKEAFFKKR